MHNGLMGQLLHLEYDDKIEVKVKFRDLIRNFIQEIVIGIKSTRSRWTFRESYLRAVERKRLSLD